MDEARAQVKMFGEGLNKVKLNEHRPNAEALVTSIEELVGVIKETFSIN